MKRVIAWFAGNSVSANLLMALLLLGGLITLPYINQEVFPEFSTDMISISVVYPGAAPQEVEEGVCVRIEEQILAISGIKQVTSVASEGRCMVTVEVLTGADIRTVMDEVKSRVDAIETFPEEIESPVIQEVLLRRQVINVAVYGDLQERLLRELAEAVREDLLALPEITQVDLAAVRPYEISIEVSEDTLRRHGVTFQEVADAVRRFSIDLPGGVIRSPGGEILLRTKGSALTGEDFAEIPLIARRDGSRLLVGDLARVVDGFAETDHSARFDEHPTALLQVFRVGSQSALEISDSVKKYIERKHTELPEEVGLTTWQDDSEVLRSRIDLLVKNGLQGLLLVIVILLLFLRARLAFWVTVGIAVSFMGTLLVLPLLDVSINLISLFAFIVVLGIVVDDAIVVGENVHVQYRKGKDPLRAAIDGASEMIVPVTFGVCTTLAAFLPLLAVPGVTGKIFQVVPLVVIPTLIFSLIEVFFILPAHLAHRGESKKDDAKGLVDRFFHFFESGFERANQRLYQPVLRFCLSWRYASLGAGLMILLLMFGLVGGGRISFTFFPEVEADNVLAALKMPLGTPAEETARVVARLEAAAEAVRQEFDSARGPGEPSIFRHILSTIGSQPTVADSGPGGPDPTVNLNGGHLAEINIELISSQFRGFASEAVAERWRELAGPVPGATELRFTSSLFAAGDPIDIQLVGPDVERLRQAAERLKELVQRYPGVFDAAHTFQAGKQEIRLNTTTKAQQLGISELDLARQVRQAFHGEEAQRVQRGRDDVKVMVRYPEENRRSIGELENMRIRLSGGGEVPFSTVAQVELGTGFSSIRRVDRQRAVNVTANVDTARVTANQILTEVEANDLPLLMAEFPEIRYSLEGEQREQRETLQALGRGFLLALLLIFALMAIPLRSYFQPLLIMTAIPFGCVGAVIGHLLMGHDLSIISMFGMVALAGVVVNANLVLIDYINRRYREGTPLRTAVQEAGVARFRPVLLTAFTTFGGLTPLLAEQSLQAQFLIPMAISIAFGVLFSTGVSLLLVPALYLIHEDVKEAFSKTTGISIQQGSAPIRSD